MDTISHLHALCYIRLVGLQVKFAHQGYPKKKEKNVMRYDFERIVKKSNIT